VAYTLSVKRAALESEEFFASSDHEFRQALFIEKRVWLALILKREQIYILEQHGVSVRWLHYAP
jgi:hypothetical protein